MKLRGSKIAALTISIISLLVMFFSIPWNYPSGIYFIFVRIFAALPKSVIHAIQTFIVYFIAGAAVGVMKWQPVYVFIPLILSAVAFLIWRLSIRRVRTSKIYLWMVAVLGLPAVIADVISFRDLSGLSHRPGYSQISLIFLGHAIFVVWVVYYYWRLLRKPRSTLSEGGEADV